MRVSDLTTKEGQKILKQELNTQLREKEMDNIEKGERDFV